MKNKKSEKKPQTEKELQLSDLPYPFSPLASYALLGYSVPRGKVFAKGTFLK
jgi:hypothetical protein